MNLHTKQVEFVAAVRLAAESLKLKPEIIEKDYWVTYVLKKLSSNNKLVLKGGTSLFKGYNFLNRISEDIDLTFTSSFTKDGMTKLLDSLNLDPLEIIIRDPSEKDKDGQITRRFYYPKEFENAVSHMSEGIKIELYSLTTPINHFKHRITPLINLAFSEEPALIDQYELNPFEFEILSCVETFFEKFYAVNEYIINKNVYSKYTRHVYDIVILFSQEDIKSIFQSRTHERYFERHLKLRTDRNDSIIDNQFDLISAPIFDVLTDDFYKSFATFQEDFVFNNQRIHPEQIKSVLLKIHESLLEKTSQN